MVGGAMKEWSTDFSSESAADFEPVVTRIVAASPEGAVKHVFVPSVTRLRDGLLLATCRWDVVGAAEGDATNEQALFWSGDEGSSWETSGTAIVTLVRGTGFDSPSAITHSFVFEDAGGRVWLYYSINQPFSWGAGRPGRSTGGGEIRRIRLESADGMWRATGESAVVWRFRQPVGDGHGGSLGDVRIALEDKILRTPTGTLIMAVGGRATVDDPRGAFWPLNRCWALESRDDGQTWTAAYLIGGSDSLALAEPTIESTTDGLLVCLMRVQYGTGRELYQSVSADHGRTWSRPQPTGLPNAGWFGTKPFLCRIVEDRYALLVFSEPGDAGRTGASVYLTDSAGLLAGVWPRKKALLIESPGGADAPEYGIGGYGWLAPLGGGALIAVLATHHGGAGRISAVRAGAEWLTRPVLEPISIRDDLGDDRPVLVSRADGTTALRFESARGRARDCAFAALRGYPQRVTLSAVVDRPPARARFDLCRLDGDHGRHPWLALTLDPERSRSVWIVDAAGWHDSGVVPQPGTPMQLDVILESEHCARVSIDGRPVLGGRAVHGACSSAPNLLVVGSVTGTVDECSVDLAEVSYSAPGARSGWS